MAKNLRNLSKIDHLSLSMRVQVPMLSHQMLKLNVYHLNHLQLYIKFSDMDDESENRGEKDYRFSQSSEKQYAMREIESTLEDAKNNAAFIKTQSPTWYDRFECKQCNKSGKGADCCHMHWLNKEGKNASKDPSERAMNSILPTVGDIAERVTKSLAWCTHHGCLNNA